MRLGKFIATAGLFGAYSISVHNDKFWQIHQEKICTIVKKNDIMEVLEYEILGGTKDAKGYRVKTVYKCV